MTTTINVRLCGAIPRGELGGAPRRSTSESTHQLCDGLDGVLPQTNPFSTMKTLDIPEWAVPAKGETRLEVRSLFVCLHPVTPHCPAVGRQTTVSDFAPFLFTNSPSAKVWGVKRLWI